MFFRKNIANFITCLRIIFSLLMLPFPLFSIAFWLFYALSGLSDVIDGTLARKLKIESKAGAILDSLADLVFFIVIACLLLPIVTLPIWMIVSIVIIACIRIVAYIVAFFRFHCFVSLHTYLNRLTGLSLFLSPLLFYVLGLNVAGTILITLALTSSIEELVIDISSKEVNRDIKGLLF